MPPQDRECRAGGHDFSRAIRVCGNAGFSRCGAVYSLSHTNFRNLLCPSTIQVVTESTGIGRPMLRTALPTRNAIAAFLIAASAFFSLLALTAKPSGVRSNPPELRVKNHTLSLTLRAATRSDGKDSFYFNWKAGPLKSWPWMACPSLSTIPIIRRGWLTSFVAAGWPAGSNCQRTNCRFTSTFDFPLRRYRPGWRSQSLDDPCRHRPAPRNKRNAKTLEEFTAP